LDQRKTKDLAAKAQTGFCRPACLAQTSKYQAG
jgi:hypothetical protein